MKIGAVVYVSKEMFPRTKKNELPVYGTITWKGILVR